MAKWQNVPKKLTTDHVVERGALFDSFQDFNTRDIYPNH